MGRRTLKFFMSGICILVVLIGCEHRGVDYQSAISSQSVNRSQQNGAVSDTESLSKPCITDGGSSLSSSAVSAVPQRQNPETSDPLADIVPSSIREYIPGRSPDTYFSDAQLKLDEQTQSYRMELESALSPSDYAYIGMDRVSGILGIYTMTLEKVKAVIEQHPNAFVKVQYFPSDCTWEQIKTVIDEIKAMPVIQKNIGKIDRIGRYNTPEEYNVIFISTLEEFPELDEWVKDFESSFEIRVLSSEKMKPAA